MFGTRRSDECIQSPAGMMQVEVLSSRSARSIFIPDGELRWVKTDRMDVHSSLRLRSRGDEIVDDSSVEIHILALERLFGLRSTEQGGPRSPSLLLSSSACSCHQRRLNTGSSEAGMKGRWSSPWTTSDFGNSFGHVGSSGTRDWTATVCRKKPPSK